MKLPTISEIDFKAIETPLLAQLVREATEELNSRKTQGNHLLMDVIKSGRAERQVREYFDEVPMSYRNARIEDLYGVIKHNFLKPTRGVIHYINNEIFEPNGFERIELNYKKK